MLFGTQVKVPCFVGHLCFSTVYSATRLDKNTYFPQTQNMLRRSIYRGTILKYNSWILIIERVVVTVAALAAMFPMWQYSTEARDRELDRAANFVLAYRACFGEDGVLIEDKRIQELGAELNAELARSMRSGEGTDENATRLLAARLKSDLQRVSQTMAESCQQLEQIYLR